MSSQMNTHVNVVRLMHSRVIACIKYRLHRQFCGSQMFFRYCVCVSLYSSFFLLFYFHFCSFYFVLISLQINNSVKFGCFILINDKILNNLL